MARDLLAEFQALIERDVLARDGSVVSFMGDGAMIVFGLPQPRPDDASRAFLAIMRLRATMVSWLGGLPPAARDRLGAGLADISARPWCRCSGPRTISTSPRRATP